MFSIWALIAITLSYITFIFLVASAGEKLTHLPKPVYSLALGVHCTSWAFFGTTTQAAQFGWPLVPTYLGIILVMVFGFKLVVRLANICQKYNITSIAELLSIRFKHSNVIALLVTSICFIGVIPYIALQLDAITLAINLLIRDSSEASNSISLYVTVAMALFAIYFGARQMNLASRNSGLMLTIAVQSLVKLFGLCAVGIFVVYGVFDGLVDLLEQSLNNKDTRSIIEKPFAIWIYLSHVILGVGSMFCLPRQFHVNFVEFKNINELNQARWLFPLYLIAMSLFILPIALGGSIAFSDPTKSLLFSTDSYVLAFPIFYENKALTIVAFLGGLAASSSMVIIATLALGNMMASSLITPLWLHLRGNQQLSDRLSADQILRIRQATILVMMGIAYWYHKNISQSTTLVETGTISISLLSQTFPAIVLGIYWRKTNLAGALSGIIVGVSIIIFAMLYPAIAAASSGITGLDGNQIAFVLFTALSANLLCTALISKLSFNGAPNPFASSILKSSDFIIRFVDLKRLTDRLLPKEVTKTFDTQTRFFSKEPEQTVPDSIVVQAESLLSSHMGRASARILLNAISDHRQSSINNMGDLVEQAGRDFQFNKEILQASITHLPLGVSVIDAELRLVAWNDIYERLFNYPKDFLHVGKPILSILEFNAERGFFGDLPAEREIEKRIQNMVQGRSYKVVRPQLFDKVVEISGNPLPAGGFITCYSDISEYIEIQNQLEEAKTELEERVAVRTKQLEQAKTEAEHANVSKTKFLAATSHDLVQPLNAASLFASMLADKMLKGLASPKDNPKTLVKEGMQQDLQQLEQQQQELIQNVINSLENAESLLNMLIEMTKLENKRITPNVQTFALHEVLANLQKEFSVFAAQKNITLTYVKSSAWVCTDRRLLSRILQNLISNAIRYTHNGKVVIGVRNKGKHKLELVVADSGTGIAEQYQQKIFNEFQRLNPNDEHQGLGLGLTIVERISQLLNIPIQLRSKLGKGSSFSLTLQRQQGNSNTNSVAVRRPIALNNPEFLKGYRVLALENDEAVSQALYTLLTTWGATVEVASDQKSAIALKHPFDIMVADYHLNSGDTGISVLKQLVALKQRAKLNILSSADRSEEIQEAAYELNMLYLPKPIKQAALKRLIQKHLS